MKKFLAIILTLTAIQLSYAQEDNFVDGYIVTNDSKIVFTKLAYIVDENAHISCVEQTKKGTTKEYFPKDLKGYGFVGGDLYNSVKEDGVFAKVLIKGSVSLWKYEKQLYLFHSERIYNLEKEGMESVRSIFETCLESKEVNKNLKHKEQALKQLVISFNTCKNEDFTTYGEKIPDVQVEYGILAGIENSSISFSSSNNIYEYLRGNFESSDPFYGFSINFSLPKSFEGFSVQQDVRFSSATFFNFSAIERSSNETRFYYTTVNFDEISFPFSIKYSHFEVSGFHPYVQLGLNYRILQSVSSVQLETLEGNAVTIEEETEAFEAKEKAFGTWLGLGATRKFNSFKGDLFFRYYPANELSNIKRLSAKNSRITFGILISYIQEFHK